MFYPIRSEKNKKNRIEVNRSIRERRYIEFQPRELYIARLSTFSSILDMVPMPVAQSLGYTLYTTPSDDDDDDDDVL